MDESNGPCRMTVDVLQITYSAQWILMEIQRGILIKFCTWIVLKHVSLTQHIVWKDLFDLWTILESRIHLTQFMETIEKLDSIVNKHSVV